MAITIDDIKKLSPQARALIVALIVLVFCYLYYFYFLSDALEKKTTLDKKLEDMHGQIREKEVIAAQVNKYKADVEALTENYKTALLKLPDQREIPGLFHSVAMAGRDAGIEFVLFEPKAAVPKVLDKQFSKEEPKAAALFKPSDQQQQEQKPEPVNPATKAAGGKKTNAPELDPFYEEIPVGVTVTGTFQNIVYFFEKVAKLPRIVNISDITMGDRKDVKGRGYIITTNCTIKTYMFVDKKKK